MKQWFAKENGRSEAWPARDSLFALEFVRTHGRKWNELGAQLGRTPSSCRNHIQRLQRTSGKAKNVCARCGKPKRAHVCLMDGSIKELTMNSDILPDEPQDFVSPPQLTTERESPTTVQEPLHVFPFPDYDVDDVLTHLAAVPLLPE